MADNIGDDLQPKQETENAPDDQNDLWCTRLERRERALKDISEKSHWERYIREYQGDWSMLLSGTDRIIPLNLMYAYVRSEIPSLYQQDPYYEFIPKQDTTIGSAKLKEIAVNDIWHRKKFKREVKKGIQDGKLVGHAWYKVGYNANLGNIEQFEDATENPNNEDYFFYRINWRHMFFNDESVDPPFDATWIAQKFFVPLAVAKANPDWANREKLLGVKLSGADKREDVRNLSINTEGDIEYAELYEIWDKVNQVVLIASRNKNVGIMHSRPWPYETMQGYPFLFLNLSFVNDSPYGISDAGMGEKHVLEKTKLRTAFLEHVKRGNRQLLTTPDNFSQEAKDAYRKGDDSALLEAQHPEQVLPLPYAAFQTDAFGLESRLDDDLAQIWGQRPNDRAGQARTQTRTKYELQAQNVGTTNRLAEQQNIIQDLVVEAAEKLSSLLEQYATTPFYVQLTGYQPEQVAQILAARPSLSHPGAVTNRTGFTLNNSDIKGPVDVRIQEGSAIPLDKQSKLVLLKELGQMYMEMESKPAGPFIAALAKMIVEESGLHELSIALEQEGQFRAKQAEQQAKQMQEQQNLMTGHKAAELQLKAQGLATEQQKVDSTTQLELLKIIKDIKLQLVELQAEVAMNKQDSESRTQVSD